MQNLKKKTLIGRPERFFGVLFVVALIFLTSILFLTSKSSQEKMVSPSIWESDREMFDFLHTVNIQKKPDVKEIVNITKNKTLIHLNDNRDNNRFLEDLLKRYIEKEGVEIISSLGHVEINAQRKRIDIENHSSTNGDSNYCNIILSYKPIEHWSAGYQPQKKLLVSLTHELSHCLLGKEIFTKGIEWESSSQNKINESLIHQSVKSWTLLQQGKNILNPLVLYHETFADIFSIAYLYNTNILNKHDIEKILETRKQDCEGKDFCNYQSYKLKDDIFKFLKIAKDNEMKIEEVFYFSNLLSKKVLLDNL